ncbi:MAG: hypothetical protein N2C14_09165, partial [Planctomycetales bacterium]
PDRQPAPDDPNDPVELLDLIDIKENAVTGFWRFRERDLETPQGVNAALRLPRKPPAEYVLTVVLERMAGEGGIHFVISVGEKQVDLVLGDFKGKLNGLQLVADRTVRGNDTTFSREALPIGKEATMECVVTEDRVLVRVDDEKIVDFKGLDQLSLGVPWNQHADGNLMIGVQKAMFRVRKMELKPLTEELKAALPPHDLSFRETSSPAPSPAPPTDSPPDF